MNPSIPAFALPEPARISDHKFEKAILRLVRSSAERRAIAAGQVDAVIDPATRTAILLPEAQRALVARHALYRSMAGLGYDWYWEQDEHHRFTASAGVNEERSGFTDEDLIGKALWELAIDNVSESDWRTYRQQLDWRAMFRDFEVRHAGRDGGVRYLSISGMPVFDDQNRFKGYRGITREITRRKHVEVMAQVPAPFVHATLDALTTAVGALDAAGVVLATNKAWRDVAAGLGADVAEGGNYLEACEDAGAGERLDGIAIAAGIRQVIAGERGRFLYEHAYDTPAGRRWALLSATTTAGEGAPRVVVSREDITDRKHDEGLLGLAYAVAQCLDEAGDTRAVLRAVIRLVCESQAWDCGRYFRLDPAAGVLIFDESWGIPAERVGQFLEKSRGLAFPLGAGLKGRVCQSGQPLWVLAGAHDNGLAASALAPETDAGGVFVMPVSADDRALGVLAFSSPAVREPDDRMLRAMRAIGGQLGCFLERQKTLEELRRSEARFRRLTELSSDWCWEQDRDFRFTHYTGYAVPGAGDVIGKRYWELPNIVQDDAHWARYKSQLAAQWSFCDFEFTARLPDGQLGHYSISGEPVYDAAGAFAGYRGTGLDVTRRVRAGIELRERAAPPAGAATEA